MSSKFLERRVHKKRLLTMGTQNRIQSEIIINLPSKPHPLKSPVNSPEASFTSSTVNFTNPVTLDFETPNFLSENTAMPNSRIDIPLFTGCSLSKELAAWAVSGHVSQQNFTKLLSILKKPRDISEFQSLPNDCRSLLKTVRRNSLGVSEFGSYYHFGLSESILFI
ncbi:hypothetical protein JTB14_001494 [Gonioctena quinquepunctata]|nr:hypothetical protein JTB14_001494 [Gonioctena quinquepunctata]